MINMMEVETRPLVEAVYEAVVKAGGLPEVYYSSDWLKRILLRNGSDEQVDWVPEIESYGMELGGRLHRPARRAEPVRVRRHPGRAARGAPARDGQGLRRGGTSSSGGCS